VEEVKNRGEGKGSGKKRVVKWNKVYVYEVGIREKKVEKMG